MSFHKLKFPENLSSFSISLLFTYQSCSFVSYWSGEWRMISFIFLSSLFGFATFSYTLSPSFLTLIFFILQPSARLTARKCSFSPYKYRYVPASDSTVVGLTDKNLTDDGFQVNNIYIWILEHWSQINTRRYHCMIMIICYFLLIGT